MRAQRARADAQSSQKSARPACWRKADPTCWTWLREARSVTSVCACTSRCARAMPMRVWRGRRVRRARDALDPARSAPHKSGDREDSSGAGQQQTDLRSARQPLTGRRPGRAIGGMQPQDRRRSSVAPQGRRRSSVAPATRRRSSRWATESSFLDAAGDAGLIARVVKRSRAPGSSRRHTSPGVSAQARRQKSPAPAMPLKARSSPGLFSSGDLQDVPEDRTAQQPPLPLFSSA